MPVFAQDYSSQYDQLYVDKNYLSECDLVEEAIARFASKSIGRVLDIGCGTGSHSIELSKRGYKVTGVDLSQHMLDEAALKSTFLQKDSRPTWLAGDARDFDAGDTFDLGIMMFAVVGYLTTNEDIMKGLRNIRRQLKTGALFVCDFWYGPSVLTDRPKERIRVFKNKSGRVIRSSSTTLDIERHIAQVNFKLWMLEGDHLIGETSETHHLRYFFPQEFCFFLSCSGFKLEKMSAFPSLDKPLGDDTWNALVVASAI